MANSIRFSSFIEIEIQSISVIVSAFGPALWQNYRADGVDGPPEIERN